MGRRQHIHLTPDAFPQEIKAFLGTVHSLTYPGQGYTSHVAIVVAERGTYVVKRAQGEQFSRWLAHEYRVLQALREVPLPLPQPYHYAQCCLSGMPESWLIMSCLPGDSLRVVARTEHDQAAKRQMLYTVGQALARLHHFPVPPSLMAEKQEPWLDSMLKQARYHLHTMRWMGVPTCLSNWRGSVHQWSDQHLFTVISLWTMF